jgi:hypothetical protein
LNLEIKYGSFDDFMWAVRNEEAMERKKGGIKLNGIYWKTELHRFGASVTNVLFK